MVGEARSRHRLYLTQRTSTIFSSVTCTIDRLCCASSRQTVAHYLFDCLFSLDWYDGTAQEQNENSDAKLTTESLEDTKRLVNEMGTKVSGKCVSSLGSAPPYSSLPRSRFQLIVTVLCRVLTDTDVLAHALLAQKLSFANRGWVDRLILLNLRDNSLTDLSCRVSCTSPAGRYMYEHFHCYYSR